MSSTLVPWLRSAWRRCALAPMLVLALLALGPDGLRLLHDIPPFRQVAIYQPVQTPADALLLLHGKQELTAPDPTWMAWLRTRPGFLHRTLVVPALGDAEWHQPAVISRLETLFSAHAGGTPHRWLVGFSAGASRGFGVAAALSGQLRGFVAIAGSPSGVLSLDQLEPLKAMPILMICLGADTVVPCSRVEAGALKLQKAGFSRVEFRRIPGLRHECELGVIAPILHDWMEKIKG